MLTIAGNGIHLAFEDDPGVLYISIHRYESGTFYPGGELGGPKSCGKGAGLGLYVLYSRGRMRLTRLQLR